MWTDFVACPGALPAYSEEDFHLNILDHLASQPGVAGLLRYLPPGMLVRIHVGLDGLHITALKTPKDSAIFAVGSEISINLGKGLVNRDRAQIYNNAMNLPPRSRCVAFFFTEDDLGILARKGTTKMVLLEHVKLYDLTDTSKFTLQANFELTPGDSEYLAGKHHDRRKNPSDRRR